MRHGFNALHMAEGVGFEPTEGCPSPVFKTGTFGQLSHPSAELRRIHDFTASFPLFSESGVKYFSFFRRSVPTDSLTLALSRWERGCNFKDLERNQLSHRGLVFGLNLSVEIIERCLQSLFDDGMIERHLQHFSNCQLLLDRPVE